MSHYGSMSREDILAGITDGTFTQQEGTDYLSHLYNDQGEIQGGGAITRAATADAQEAYDTGVAQGFMGAGDTDDGEGQNLPTAGTGGIPGIQPLTQAEIDQRIKDLTGTREGRQELFTRQQIAQQDPFAPQFLQRQRSARFAPLDVEAMLRFAGEFQQDPSSQMDFNQWIQNQAGGGMRSPISTYGGFNTLLNRLNPLYDTQRQLTQDEIVTRQFLEDNASNIIMQAGTAGLSPMIAPYMRGEIGRRLGLIPIGTNPFAAFQAGGWQLPGTVQPSYAGGAAVNQSTGTGVIPDPAAAAAAAAIGAGNGGAATTIGAGNGGSVTTIGAGNGNGINVGAAGQPPAVVGVPTDPRNLYDDPWLIQQGLTNGGTFNPPVRSTPDPNNLFPPRTTEPPYQGNPYIPDSLNDMYRGF